MSHLPDQFNDEQARAILGRAIEIDAQGGITTVEALRAIATEIGVSPEALEAAVYEHQTSTEHRQRAAAQRNTTRVAALGIPVGVTTGLLLGSGAALPALAVMAAGLFASGGLVVGQAPANSLRSFLLKNFLLWGGVYAGSVAATAIIGSGSGLEPTLIAAGWCLRSWVASSILGSAGVIASRRARPSLPSETSSDGANVRTSGGRLMRAAKRLLGRFNRPFTWRSAPKSLLAGRPSLRFGLPSIRASVLVRHNDR